MSTTAIADIGALTAATATFTAVFGEPVRGGGRLREPVPGPVLGRGIEPVEDMALGKAIGPATVPAIAITPHEGVPPIALGAPAPTARPIVRQTVPGNAIMPHDPARPIVLAAPAPIARPIVQRTVPQVERSPQGRHDLRRGGPVEGRMADTIQGALRGRTVLAVRGVAVVADEVAVAADGVASHV